MTDEEVAIRLEGHNHEIESLKHRMCAVEAVAKSINDLGMQVKGLALNMNSFAAGQKSMIERLETIEKRPIQTINSIRQTAITAIVSAISGGLAVWVAQGIAQYLK